MVQCRAVVLSQGGEESGEVFVIEGQEIDVPGGRGVANFVMKFKGGSSCNINVVSKVSEIRADDFNVGPVTVCELECRGCEVVSWRCVHVNNKFKICFRHCIMCICPVMCHGHSDPRTTGL